MAAQANILVVEDHADSAQALVRLLAAEGHRVSHADGYASAIDLARGQRYDLMLCDIGLPDGDGCDLLREVRSLYHLPAVALTGFGMPDDTARCRDAGFDTHMLKPVTAERVIAAVKRLLAGHGPAGVDDER
jgi:CheY-like chemotaxis protein